MTTQQDEPFQIRQAAIRDAAGIARVRVISWRDTYQGIIPQEVLDGLSVEEASRWLESMIRKNAPGSCYLVAQDRGGQIVGFALGGPERTSDPEYVGELYAIYILPDFLRIGIGRRLVLAMVGCLFEQGFRSMLIWTLAENPSRKFYEKMGGSFVREQPITIGPATLPEVAYGWKDLSSLIQAGGASAPCLTES